MTLRAFRSRSLVTAAVILTTVCLPTMARAQNHASDATQAGIQFSDESVIASGFSPGSSIVFFAAGLVPTGYESTVRKWSATQEANHDGVVELKVDIPIPCKSIWVAVSLRDSKYAIAAPPGCSLRVTTTAPKHFRRGGSHNVDLFSYGRASVDLLYVHPGLGAWKGFAYDGARDSDGDGTADGVATARLRDLEPLAGTPVPPAFAAGGLLFALDYHRLDVSVVRVDAAMLDGVQ